jgi:hypothetical protein
MLHKGEGCLRGETVRNDNHSLLRMKSTILNTAGALMFCIVGGRAPVTADELPALRSGLWEYQRTVQRSDENWSPKDTTVRECENPISMMQKQNEVYRKLGCAIATTRVTESTYQVTADCPTRNGIKTESRGVTTFDGDSAYASVIDSEGAVAGKSVKFVERLSAKWIGDCEKK